MTVFRRVPSFPNDVDAPDAVGGLWHVWESEIAASGFIDRQYNRRMPLQDELNYPSVQASALGGAALRDNGSANVWLQDRAAVRPKWRRHSQRRSGALAEGTKRITGAQTISRRRTACTLDCSAFRCYGP